jgi:hypothetical protein
MTSVTPEDQAWIERCKIAYSGRCPRGDRVFGKHLYKKNGECRRCGFTVIKVPPEQFEKLKKHVEMQSERGS